MQYDYGVLSKKSEKLVKKAIKQLWKDIIYNIERKLEFLDVKDYKKEKVYDRFCNDIMLFTINTNKISSYDKDENKMVFYKIKPLRY